MRTVLFVDNTICSNLEQLKDYFVNSLSPNTTIYEELLTIYRDGILTEWLSEGETEEEHNLYEKLSRIPDDLSNTELIRRILNYIFGDGIHLSEPSFNDFLQIESTIIIADDILYDFASYRLKFHSFRIQLESSNASISHIRLMLKVKKIDLEVLALTINDKYFDYSYTENIYLNKYKLGETIILDLPIHQMTNGLHFVEIKSGSSQLVNYIFDISRYRTLIEEIRPTAKDGNLSLNNHKGVLWDIIYSTGKPYIIGSHGHSSSYAGRYELDNILSILCDKQIQNDDISYIEMISVLQGKGFELVSPPKYRYGQYKVFNAIAQKIDAPFAFTIVIENASDHSAQSMNNALNAKGNWVSVAVGLLEHYPNYLKEERVG